MLESASPVPLYCQLAELLEDRIRQGLLCAGQKIPSEHELSESYGIGRPTVRQATDLLVRRGLVERRRGSGTFVSETDRRVDLFSLGGTLRGFRESGIDVTPEVLEPLREVEVPRDSRQPFAGRRALAFSRLSRVGRRPVLLERFTLRADLFASLVGEDLSGSLSDIARRKLRLRPSRAEQCFSAAAVDGKRARALALKPKTVVLRVEREVYFVGVEGAGLHAELFCRTDRLSFCQTLQGDFHA